MNQNEKILNKISELDLLILNLFYANGAKPIRDGTFFQKEFFLVADFIKEIKPRADFIPHMFGPYSEPAEVSLNNLISINLIEKDSSGFRLTELGKEICEASTQKIPSEEKEAIEDFKELLNDLTRDELLVFTYFSYPEMTKESGILERIKQKRIPVSISLYNKRKVSLEKAAFLSGLPMGKFIKVLEEIK